MPATVLPDDCHRGCRQNGTNRSISRARTPLVNEDFVRNEQGRNDSSESAARNSVASRTDQTAVKLWRTTLWHPKMRSCHYIFRWGKEHVGE